MVFVCARRWWRSQWYGGISAVIMISFHLKYAIKYRKLQKKGVTTGSNTRISDVCGCKTGLTLLCWCVYFVEAGWKLNYGMCYRSRDMYAKSKSGLVSLTCCSGINVLRLWCRCILYFTAYFKWKLIMITADMPPHHWLRHHRRVHKKPYI